MIRTWAVPFALPSRLARRLGARRRRRTPPFKPRPSKTDPIRCWWRTSARAVRVGEPFSVVFTCAVIETESVTVVPNQAELDPDAVQLPPFDVIGGSQGTDLRTADHRFFQYRIPAASGRARNSSARTSLSRR